MALACALLPLAAARGGTTEEVGAKLKALERLRQFGLLTPEEYERRKAELLGQRAAAARPAGPATLAARNRGNTYRHPLGYTLWYPQGWTVTQRQGFLQLVPPSPGAAPRAITELYFVLGESVAQEGVQRPDDPRVISFLDQQVRGTFPAMQRVGGISPIDTAKGRGIVLDWEGKSPQGQVVRARAYASIIRGHGVALVAVATKERLAAREPVLRRIVASFGIGEGQSDRALVGTWTFVSTHAISNESGVKMGVETAYTKAQAMTKQKSLIELRADGTWKRTEESEFLAMGAYNPVTGTRIVLDSGPTRTVTKGRWNAGAGRLYMVSDKNLWEEYTYEIRRRPEGRVLKLVAGKSCDLWTEKR